MSYEKLKASPLLNSPHQPKDGTVAHPLPSPDELSRTCGSSVGLILAIDEGTTPLKIEFEDPDTKPIVLEDKDRQPDAPGTPRPLQRYKERALVEHAVDCAFQSRLADVFVLLKETGAHAELIAQAAASSKEGAPKFGTYDEKRDGQLTKEHCDFALFDVTMGILDAAKKALESCSGADSVLIMSCDQVRLTPWHIYEVCRAFKQRPELDAVSSWITWLSRLPLLVSKSFLESLSGSTLTAPGADGRNRPVPHLKVEQVVFGEEKLAANKIVPARVNDFFKGCTLTARQAVQLARQKRAQKEEDKKKAEKGAPERSEADKLLLEIADESIERLESMLSKADSECLAKADSWAKRNALDFPLLNDAAHRGKLAYLDTAATAQRLGSSLEAQEDFDKHLNANIYRGCYELSARSTALFNEARATIEGRLGAKRRSLVFCMNTSAACNIAAQTWGEANIGPDDAIVLPLSEHHSNLLPWTNLAKRKGARIIWIPLRADGHLDLDAYDAALEEGPKLVCMAHVGNVLGLEIPEPTLARKAHRAGARFFLDAAQSAAHLPLKVDELCVDFLALSAHKMYGPLGIGGLWISEEALQEMEPASFGGGAISHVSTDTYYLRARSIQYEIGTPPISAAIGWAEAIRYLDALGMENIKKHGIALSRYLAKGLCSIDGLTVWGDHGSDADTGGLVSFSIAGIAPLNIGVTCGKLGVALRTGGHCALPLAASMGITGSARASLGVYTTKEDIEALIVALQVCKRLYRPTLAEGRAL